MLFFAVALWIHVEAGQPTPQGSTLENAAAVSASRVHELTVQVTVTPETVTVGDHFTVTVHAHVPASLAAALQFPDGPDSYQRNVAGVVPMQRHHTRQGEFVDATAIYVLSAWLPGRIEASLGNLVIGKTNIIIPSYAIVVRSVLPNDSVARARAKPKPPRPLLAEPLILGVLRHPQKYPFLVVSFLLLLLATSAWLLWRRARRRAAAKVSTDWAESEFQRIEAMHLLELGEPEQYAILMTTVVRQYFIRAFATVRESATTRELSTALHGEPLIPEGRVLALFEQVDLLKFAHAEIQAAEAQAAGRECRAIVNEILDRHQAAVIALEKQRQVNAAMIAIAAAVMVVACESPAPQRTWAHIALDTVHIALYNRGTTLLERDSLTAALPLLNSAMASKDPAVKFRAAFNGGWDYLVNSTRTIASAYVNMQLDSSLVKYRSALVINPNDLDTKWNYELALRMSQAAGGKGKGNKQEKAPGKGQSKNMKERSNQQHPAEKLRLSQQQAEQLLNAMGQRERQAAKAVLVPPPPPPQGKDW